nr:MAG TPA: hypothetical protein [Caudoviricetes sp.]
MSKTKTIKGTTSTGFEFEISQDRLNNYELVEAIAEVDTNPLVLPRLLNLMLGPQAQNLKDNVRTDEGLVPMKALMSEVEEIFANQKPVKN